MALRIMGKKQIGEMEPSELVVAIIISEIISIPIADPSVPILHGILPLFALTACELILSAIACKSEKFRALIYGVPSKIINNGAVDQKEMLRLRLTINELVKELRLSGFSDISQINCCVLETNGRLSVIPFAKDAPPTRSDVGIRVSDPGLMSTIIADGRVNTHNLFECTKDEAWLMATLKANGVTDPSLVFYLGVDELNKVTLVKKEGLR